MNTVNNLQYFISYIKRNKITQVLVHQWKMFGWMNCFKQRNLFYSCSSNKEIIIRLKSSLFSLILYFFLFALRVWNFLIQKVFSVICVFFQIIIAFKSKLSQYFRFLLFYRTDTNYDDNKNKWTDWIAEWKFCILYGSNTIDVIKTTKNKLS